ncbi:uncharacterized protein METZ01_LOCUS482973, partial [marine metagenome]
VSAAPRGVTGRIDEASGQGGQGALVQGAFQDRRIGFL